MLFRSPALSRAIQQLEGELGGELVRREGRLSHLTDFGRAVLPALRQCHEASQSARALAKAYLKEGHAPLQLALSRSIEFDVISPLLAEITNAFPGIEVKLFRGPPGDIAEKLKSGEVEVAVAGPFPSEWDRFDARKLFEERFGILVGKRHKLAKETSVKPAALLDERLLCRPLCPLAERLLAELQRQGARKLVHHEVPLIDDLMGMVRANLGAAVMPASRAGGEISVIDVEGIDLTRWIHVVTVAGRRQSTAAATLVKLLRARDWSAPTRPAAGKERSS